MSQTTVNIRMDSELKKQFEDFCSDVGMDMSTALCVFAKKAVRERRIPFKISIEDPFYSYDNQERLRRSISQLENTGGAVYEADFYE